MAHPYPFPDFLPHRAPDMRFVHHPRKRTFQDLFVGDWMLSGRYPGESLFGRIRQINFLLEEEQYVVVTLHAWHHENNVPGAPFRPMYRDDDGIPTHVHGHPDWLVALPFRPDDTAWRCYYPTRFGGVVELD